MSYLDVKTRKRFKFLTNNFTLPALTIVLIYKSRWQVELFFKWIKQHLLLIHSSNRRLTPSWRVVGR